MNAPRRMTTAFLIAAISAISCDVPVSTHPPIESARLDDWPSEIGGDARGAARLLGRLHTGLMPDEVARLGVAIVRESRRAGIPMELVLALIQVESSGNAFAVSHVGAMGLMQLLPSTAEEVAGELGIHWVGPSTLFEPVTNIRLGVEYLRQLVKRYDDVSTALAAYNWGPGRIGDKLRRGEAIPAGYSGKVMATYGQPHLKAI
jgi:hypothetical protein